MHCRFTSSADFMQELLPVPDKVIDGILERMKSEKVYSNNRWKGFPVSSGTLEKEVYKAFYEVANLIHEAAKVYKTHDDSNSEYLGTTEWVDSHMKAPVSQDLDGAAIRPDAILVLRPSSTGADEQQDDDSSSLVGWLQAVVAVEMKRTDSTNAKEYDIVIKQIIGYLRRALREQLDRRFIFGFTLGPSQMTVLVHDRSGVLVTDTAIDIHKDPKAFIRLIAAFTILPAHQLGYDPSMEIYDRETKTATPSYRLGKAIYAKRHNDIQWQITLNDGEKYLTVKALSLSRAGFLHGSRSTITWAVIRMRTSENKSMQQATDKVSSDENTRLKVFVLKQSWAPVGSKTEGELYDIAEGINCDKISEVLLCQTVLVNKEPDETGKFIRKGLKSTPTPASPDTKKRARHPSDDAGSYPGIHAKNTDLDSLSQAHESAQFVSRVRVRSLLATYGWPLRKFCSVGELIRTIRDVIEGHKYLYDHRVLHRDISAGNIIIVQQESAPDKEPSYGGCLIDLDRAKEGLKIAVKHIPTESQQQNVHMELSHYFGSDALRIASAALSEIKKYTFKTFQNFTVQPDVVQWAASLHPDTTWFQRYGSDYGIAAVVHAVRFGDVRDGGNCSAATLSWKQVTRQFNYQGPISHEGSNGHGTGTPPYASGEILSEELYFEVTANRQYGHDAVHDMESLFWVLIEICLTRNGASGKRVEFTDQAPEQSNLANPTDPKPSHGSLNDLVWCLFDTGDLQTLAKFKRQFFKNSWAFNNQLLGNFHPSFKPLWPLVSAWHSVLRLAHKYHGYEYHTIHERSLALFDKFIKTEGPELDRLDDAGRQMVEARLADLRTFEAFEVAVAADDIQAHPQSDIWQHSPHANRSSHSGQASLLPDPNTSPTRPPQNKKIRY